MVRAGRRPCLRRAIAARIAEHSSAAQKEQHFVVAVLSDLFGIQARSGCFCAGPYIHRMSPIDDLWSERMHAEVAKGHLGAKLAFTRLSFNYFISEAVFRYILDAVHLLAEHGWRLLPLYRFDPASGLWRHRAAAPAGPAGLGDLGARLDAAPARLATAPESALAVQLDAARELVAALAADRPADPLDGPEVTADFERIRWFPLRGRAG